MTIRGRGLERGRLVADEGSCSVVGVEGGGTGRFKFPRRQDLLQRLALCFPLVIARIEGLGQSTPADATHERTLFLVGWASALR